MCWFAINGFGYWSNLAWNILVGFNYISKWFNILVFLKGKVGDVPWSGRNYIKDNRLKASIVFICVDLA